MGSKLQNLKALAGRLAQNESRVAQTRLKLVKQKIAAAKPEKAPREALKDRIKARVAAGGSGKGRLAGMARAEEAQAQKTGEHAVQEGPKGGRYYITGAGVKVYVK